MSVDFDTWYEYFGDDNAERHFHEVRWNYPKEEQLPKDKLAEFCSIFDGFFLSPCDFIEGVPERREFITKARAYKTLDEAKEVILSSKKLFEKYPDRIPVIIQKGKDSDPELLDKCKYLT